MGSRTELGLTLTVEGASDEELMRGLRAAIEVFDAAGVTPRQSAEAHFARDGWDEGGFDPASKPIEAVMNTAELWDSARVAAVDATSAGWPTPPADATLDLA